MQRSKEELRHFKLWYDSVDSEDIVGLWKVAKERTGFYAARAIRFPDDVHPTEAAATLRSRFAYLPSNISGSPLSDFVSYPAYLFTQLAEKFPYVHRCDLDLTVQKLAECHHRCGTYSL